MQLNYRILVVDDISDNIQFVMNILKEDDYELSYAMSGHAALDLIRKNQFDLILLDIMMPDMDGYEVCQQIQQDDAHKDIPILFLTARADIDSISKGFEAGGVDYIIKPFHAAELLARVRTHLELHASRMLLRQNNLSLKMKAEMTEKRLLTELESTQMEMIHLLTELMEFTSDETGLHIRRVAEFSRLLAQLHPSLSKEDENTIFHAAPMHDIGKALIPEAILHKAGKLTQEEFEVMKEHTTKAHKFLSHSSRRILKAADVIAHQHHEKWDGSGYPQGLKGHDIHIYGRIVALADVFDALSHRRAYKPAWTISDTLNYIIEQKGIHFDPQLVDLLMANIDAFVQITAEH